MELISSLTKSSSGFGSSSASSAFWNKRDPRSAIIVERKRKRNWTAGTIQGKTELSRRIFMEAHNKKERIRLFPASLFHFLIAIMTDGDNILGSEVACFSLQKNK
jgi:hypothetical protein